MENENIKAERENTKTESKGQRPFISIEEYEKYYTILIPLILTFIIELLKGLYRRMTNATGPQGIPLKDAFPLARLICILFCLLLLFLSFLVILFINRSIKAKLFNNPDEEKYMKGSFLRLKEFGFRRQQALPSKPKQGISEAQFLESMISQHLACIKLAVESCFQFFEYTFSENENLVNDITFEVSFMSKSYIDNKITIVASDNKKHRTPPSMEQRKTDPNIYEKSETAEVYELEKKDHISALKIHIVEDCSNPDVFENLYEGQMDKIKSMAVLPILSSSNKLLGTLVVCVNKTSFFKIKDSHFWHELLEIYSVELGYHYLALDYCIACGQNESSLPDDYKKPF